MSDPAQQLGRIRVTADGPVSFEAVGESGPRPHPVGEVVTVSNAVWLQLRDERQAELLDVVTDPDHEIVEAVVEGRPLVTTPAGEAGPRRLEVGQRFKCSAEELRALVASGSARAARH